MMLNSKSIGNKIAEARKNLNLSQAELAKLVSISPQAVGKWERGESMPDITTLNRLAEIFGVDLNFFSENAKYAVSGMISQEHLETSSAEATSGEQRKKLNRDMSKMNLVDSDFSGLKNLHEKFSSSNMQNCLFMGSDLSGLLLNNNNVTGCDFTESDLSKSQFHRSNLSDNKFKRCSLKATEFSKSNISNCDFSDSEIINSQIHGTNIGDSIFKGCSLKGTEVSKSSLGDCDFTNADFTDAKFMNSNFGKNKVEDAGWKGTSFIDMRIQDIVFEGELEDCIFENCSFYGEVTFQNATLLNTFFKNNKKIKQVHFINCRADKLTYAFLKSNLANLNGVVLL